MTASDAATRAEPDDVHCHLCLCVRGWLHDDRIDLHRPFIEDDCAVCWFAISIMSADELERYR